MYSIRSGDRSQECTTMMRILISRKELDYYLYGRTDVPPLTLEKGIPNEKLVKQPDISKKIPNYEEKSVDILQLRYRPGVEKEFRSSEEFNKVTAAIKSIPSQLHFCYSSIPGAGFGICATETIPSGTWIGPYEGKRVSIDEIGSLLDTRYLWEIYKNGVLDHCIDGSNTEKDSSICWMKYIQCARHTTEQNTVAFQFAADVYFQTYKTIRPGEEILVWYAEYYEQYLGIPVGVRTANKMKETLQEEDTTNKVLDKAERSITETTPTATNSGKNQGLIRRRAFYSVGMTIPCSMRLDYVDRPELPPTMIEEVSTRGPILTYKLLDAKPEQQPPISPLVVTEKPISEAVSHKETITAQEKPDKSTSVNPLKTRFWKCMHCQATFPQKWALQVHSCPCVVTKPFLCSNCGKAYVSKEDLQSHASDCGGGRQYKCGYCGRSFRIVNTLSKHLKVHSKKFAAGSFRRKTTVPVP